LGYRNCHCSHHLRCQRQPRTHPCLLPVVLNLIAPL
jgi:hypothetical protein